MSEGRVRLRLAKDAAAQGDSALPVREGEARAPLGSPSIAVVAAVRGADAEAFAAQLAEAAAGSGAAATTWRAALRERAGAETSEGTLRASAHAIGDALDALVAGAGEAALRIAIGAPFVALRRADVSVLVTSGAAPVHWDPDLRALRDRFELIVAEPREGLARALIERMLRRSTQP